jgi:hypothetical protein
MALVLCAWLSGCSGTTTPAQTVTLTLKSDHSQFTGTLVRRDANSITVTGQGGDTHTFLYSELVDYKIGSTTPPTPSGTAAPSSPVSGSVPAPVPSVGPGVSIPLPQGAVFQVVARSFVDSSYAPVGSVGLGSMDSDVKSADGKVVIPAGANVAFAVRDKKEVSNRLEMDLEIASADFNNRHYVVSAAKNGSDPGAIAVFTGPETGSKEALARGTAVHIDSDSVMTFKAETPIVFKLSD